MYEIVFKNPAKKFLKGLDKDSQKRLLNKIERLKHNPRIGKPLTGNLRGLWRLRQDNYRIIYMIKDQEIVVYIMTIGSRGNVYN
jgi:mRNA interferase RelE/StbE